MLHTTGNLSTRLINYALRLEDKWGSGATVPRTLNLDTRNHKLKSTIVGGGHDFETTFQEHLFEWFGTVAERPWT